MKIAAITLTMNDDGERLEQWKRFYEGYKDDLYLHVIVDNASSTEASTPATPAAKTSPVPKDDTLPF